MLQSPTHWAGGSEQQRSRPLPAAEAGRRGWGSAPLFQSPAKGLQKKRQAQLVRPAEWSGGQKSPCGAFLDTRLAASTLPNALSPPSPEKCANKNHRPGGWWFGDREKTGFTLKRAGRRRGQRARACWILAKSSNVRASGRMRASNPAASMAAVTASLGIPRPLAMALAAVLRR